MYIFALHHNTRDEIHETKKEKKKNKPFEIQDMRIRATQETKKQYHD